MPPRNIALFNTTIIRSHMPFFQGQHHVFEQIYPEGRSRMYSSGKLEVALRRGFEPYVVTMMPQLYEFDRWWLALVPANRVFLTRHLLELFDVHRDLPRIVIEPWKRCYAAMNVAWPEHLRTPDDARDHLVTNCGVTDGASFVGFATN